MHANKIPQTPQTPHTPQKDTSNWLKTSLTWADLLKAFIAIIIAFGAAWVNVLNDIEVLKVRVSQIEAKDNEFKEETKDFRREQQKQFKSIDDKLLNIQLSLKDKKDRDD